MASRQEDKAMAGLLQKSLAADARQGAGTGKGNDCPSPEILAAYFDRALDEQETARYDLHFSQCSHCREQLAAMARAGDETGDAHEAASGGWRWLRTPAWLMPAAAAFAVLVLIAGISLHYPKRVEVASEIAPPQANAVPLPAPASPAPSQPALGAPAAPSALAIIPRNEASSANSARGKSSVAKTLQAQPLSGQKKEIEAAKPAAPQNAPGPPPTAATSADENAIVVEAPPSTATETVEVAPSKSAADSTGYVAGIIAPEEKAKRPTAPKPQPKTAARIVPAAPAVAAAAPHHAATASGFAAHSALESADKARTQQMQLASNLAALTIKTPDPRVFWMVADGGEIGRTEDGGATWKYKSLAVRGPFLAGSAPAAKVCWLLAAHNAIFRTTDGKTWTEVPAPAAADDAQFLHLEAQDARTATLISADGRKSSTTDGGKSWTIAK